MDNRISGLMFGLGFLVCSVAGADATCPADQAYSLTNGNTKFPYVLANQTPADASQVMADYAHILNCPNFSGNVGIGTAAPQSLLEVGNRTLAANIYINVTSDGSLGHQQGIQFNSYYNGSATSSYINNDFYGSYTTASGSIGHGMNFQSGRWSPFDNYWFRNAAGNVGIAFVDSSYGASALGTFASNLNLIAGGNVGIGTTTPNTSLTVGPVYVGAYGGQPTHQRAFLGGYGGAYGLGNVGNRIDIGWDSNTDYSGYIAVFNADGHAENLTAVFGSRGNGADYGGIAVKGGNVGVGTLSPTYTLHVNGTAYATGAAGALSDIRDKYGVRPLSFSALGVIANLRPVTFYWKAPRDGGMRGMQTGLIAQDVEKILPSTILTADDPRHSKAIKYNELVTVLIKAVQEQQGEIAALRTENARLRSEHTAIGRQVRKIAELSARLDRLERTRLAGTR